MQNIEPFYNWRDYYISEEDDKSPFFGQEYNEFYYDKSIYNYLIHPQWDDFGSETMYVKIIYADYDKAYRQVYKKGVLPTSATAAALAGSVPLAAPHPAGAVGASGGVAARELASPPRRRASSAPTPHVMPTVSAAPTTAAMR